MNKIIDNKSFNDFISFLANDENKEKRKDIYEKEFGVLSVESKAKFISQKTSNYFTQIVINIQKALDDEDESLVSKNIVLLSNSFNKLKKVLPLEQHKIVLNKICDKYDDNSNLLVDLILNFKNDIDLLNRKLFDFLLEDIDVVNEKKIIISDFNKKLNNQESISLIKNESFSINKDELDNVLLSVLKNSAESIRMENLSRVYAYVNTGWAQKDLIDKTSWNENNNAEKLFKIIKDIQSRPDTALRTEEEVIDRNKKLLEIFTERVNEVSIVVKIDGSSIKIKSSNLKSYCTAESGTPDVFMQDATDSTQYMMVNCTANQSLWFAADQKHDSSVIRHSSIIKEKLIGKNIEDFSLNRDSLGSSIKSDVVKKIVSLYISPTIFIKNKSNLTKLNSIFENNLLSKREEQLISLIPLINVWINNQTGNTKDILSLDKFFLVGQENTIWEDYISKNKDDKNKLINFINDFLLDFAEEIFFMIDSKRLKKNIILKNSNDFLMFLNVAPSLLNKIMHEHKENNILTESSLFRFSKICDLFFQNMNENMFKDINIKNAFLVLKSFKEEIDKNLDSNKKIQMLKKVLIKTNK